MLLAKRPLSWAVLLTLGLVSLLMWPTLQQLAGNWQPVADNVLSHGWLVLAFIVWALVREAVALKPDVTGPSPAVWVVLILAGLFWSVFYRASLAAGYESIWVLALAASVWAVFGSRIAVRMSWPIALLLLLLPIWALCHGVLWQLSVWGVGAMVGALGIPAFMDGNTIRLASGNLEIASGCAGLAFFAAAVSIAFMIGYMNRAGLREHVVLVAVAAALAVLSNWIRITIIVWRAHATDMQTSLVTEDHYTFGWVVFAIVLTAYCVAFESYGLRERAQEQEWAASPQPAVPWPRLAMAAICLMLVPLSSIAMARIASAKPDLLLPSRFAGAQAISDDPAGWRPVLQKPDAEVTLDWVANGHGVRLHEAVYLRQAQGREMIGEGNSLVPDETWQLDDIDTSGPFGLATIRAPSGQLGLVAFDYSSGRWRTPRALQAQLRIGVASLTGVPIARFTAAMVHCDPDCDAARRILELVWPQATGGTAGSP